MVARFRLWTVNTDEFSQVGQPVTRTAIFPLTFSSSDGSFDPLTLTIEAGKETVKFVDLLLGEVWVAAGQSSMQMPLAACCNPKQLADITNMHNVRILTQAPDGLAGEKPFMISVLMMIWPKPAGFMVTRPT